MENTNRLKQLISDFNKDNPGKKMEMNTKIEGELCALVITMNDDVIFSDGGIVDKNVWHRKNKEVIFDNIASFFINHILEHGFNKKQVK
jgi:uncharacterized protein YrrD